MKTCKTRPKRRNKYLSDYRKTNDRPNPLYNITTMNNIFHDKNKSDEWKASSDSVEI